MCLQIRFVGRQQTKEKMEVFRLKLRCFIQWNKLVCNDFVDCSNIFEYSNVRIIESHHFGEICSVARSKIQILRISPTWTAVSIILHWLPRAGSNSCFVNGLLDKELKEQ
jgi:hypothetical protein